MHMGWRAGGAGSGGGDGWEEKRGENWDARGADEPVLRAGVVPNTKAGEVEAVVPPDVAAEEEEERELGEEA